MLELPIDIDSPSGWQTLPTQLIHPSTQRMHKATQMICKRATTTLFGTMVEAHAHNWPIERENKVWQSVA